MKLLLTLSCFLNWSSFVVIIIVTPRMIVGTGEMKCGMCIPIEMRKGQAKSELVCNGSMGIAPLTMPILTFSHLENLGCHANP